MGDVLSEVFPIKRTHDGPLVLIRCENHSQRLGRSVSFPAWLRETVTLGPVMLSRKTGSPPQSKGLATGWQWDLDGVG